jgi:hypothetical protein
VRSDIGNDDELSKVLLRQDLPNAFPMDRAHTVLVGFADGGLHVNHLATIFRGDEISGVMSASGTWKVGSPLPNPGIRALIIRGVGDRNFLPEGGGGPLTGKFPLLGHPEIRRSQPRAQIGAYAQTNDLVALPERETQYFFQTDYVSKGDPLAQRLEAMQAAGLRGALIDNWFVADHPMAREIVMKEPYGGMSWHGRNTGEHTESAFSQKNGRPAPASIFSINEQTVNYFDLGRPARRSLSVAAP